MSGKFGSDGTMGSSAGGSCLGERESGPKIKGRKSRVDACMQDYFSFA